MHNVNQKTNSIVRYSCTYENGASCTFLVNNAGVIEIIIKGYIPENLLCESLNEVTNITIEKGVIPKINIKRSNHFLQRVAQQCQYSRIPSFGISFAIWTHPINS